MPREHDAALDDASLVAIAAAEAQIAAIQADITQLEATIAEAAANIAFHKDLYSQFSTVSDKLDRLRAPFLEQKLKHFIKNPGTSVKSFF